MKIFDTHAHYDDEAFDGERETLLWQMHREGVETIVNIGCSMDNSRQIVKWIKDYDFLYGTVGVHPSDIEELQEKDMEELAGLSQDKDIVAIGEIGLDYHYGSDNKEIQKHWFSRQLEVALAQGLPVVIHSREAAKDTLDIMKGIHKGEGGGVIHCFSYGVDMAREYLNMGYYIGIGGVLTFKNARKLKEVAAYAPMEQLVLETDAPYLAPVPYRGKRNCSLYLSRVAEELAAIKNLPVSEIYEITFENARRLYHLD